MQDNEKLVTMNTWKKDMEATKRRYVDWWQRRGIIVNMWEHFQQGVVPHADVPMPPAARDLNQKWFDPSWRARYLDWYVAHSSLMADMLPVANTQLGPGSLAAILGSVFEGGDDTIWIHPSPQFDPAIPFDRNHPNYVLHKELLKACKEQAQGHYYVGMPDLMEGLDVLAALKGTDQVLMDTVMHPEVVERQMQRINDIYFQVFDELYDIIREGDEMAFCYFSAWAPGKMTKLQSDISTMISVDDYQRFVLPFISEQCRRIPYTLYHLDGVGAIRHLPALLTIDELDAIQWTPGVGEPQGGNEKWYGLYRQILDAGKSVMCCWVTLDELPRLLEHIGTDGVHLEMDFHNEQEVEQALEIVAKASAVKTGMAAATPATVTPLPIDRILVLDGAMGTMLQQTISNFSGCSDLLCLTQPDAIAAIHRRYLDAGADLIETCTFNAQRISLADYGAADRVRDVNLAACRIAREAADDYSRRTPQKHRYVMGSIGPTNRTITPTTDSVPPLTRAELKAAYCEQIAALMEGGVDGLLIETIFDVENARVCLEAAVDTMRAQQRRLPVMLSFTVNTPDGYNMMGQNIEQFIDSLQETPALAEAVYSIGVNCHGNVQQISPLIRRLANETPYRISFYPNAGHPDSHGHYAKTPQALQAELWPLIEGHCLNIIGGCCGTTDSHIRLMAQAVEPIGSLYISPHVLSKVKQKGDNSGDNAVGASRSDSIQQSTTLTPLGTAILNGNDTDAMAITLRQLTKGVNGQQLIDGEMIPAMAELGRLFEQGRAFVPQLLMAGKAMKAAIGAISAHSPAPPSHLGRVVIGTVKGDLHDIGKNLVASMLEGCGFEVTDIGIDVPKERFVEETRTRQPDIVCMSALLTTTMGYMREVIAALEQAGLRKKVKIMVGGAPVSQRFADEIGADGYSNNANAAVAVAKHLLGR